MNDQCEMWERVKGTAFLVRSDIFEQYHVKREDYGEEGVMLKTLKNKSTDYTISLLGVYVPPEKSLYCDNIDVLYENLVSLIYEKYESDLVLLGGGTSTGCVSARTMYGLGGRKLGAGKATLTEGMG